MHGAHHLYVIWKPFNRIMKAFFDWKPATIYKNLDRNAHLSCHSCAVHSPATYFAEWLGLCFYIIVHHINRAETDAQHKIGNSVRQPNISSSLSDTEKWHTYTISVWFVRYRTAHTHTAHSTHASIFTMKPKYIFIHAGALRCVCVCTLRLFMWQTETVQEIQIRAIHHTAWIHIYMTGAIESHKERKERNCYASEKVTFCRRLCVVFILPLRSPSYRHCHCWCRYCFVGFFFFLPIFFSLLFLFAIYCCLSNAIFSLVEWQR